MDLFRSGTRPAVNIGLSVTRVGGVGHNKRQKQFAVQTMKVLAEYRQAEEFSHFGSELALQSKAVLEKGNNILKVLNQGPTDTYSVMAQQLMLDIVLNATENEKIDIDSLKTEVLEHLTKIKNDGDYDKIRDELKSKSIVELKK